MPQVNNDDNPGAANGVMPGRSHHSAPKFDGKPWSLKRFLTEIKDLAEQKGVSSKQAIQAAISYAPPADYELWGSLTSAKGNDWDAFEKELCALYPGSEGERRYNRGHLETLAREAACIPVTDHIQLGEYYRSFLTISTFLKSKGRISDQECSAKFLEGLHYSFRVELANHLRLTDPTHHIDDPWPLATLYDAALFVLSNRLGGAAAPAPSMYATGTTEGARVKTEDFDATQITRFMESDVFLNRMRSIFPHQIAPQPAYTPRGYADNRTQPNTARAPVPAHYNVNMNAAPPVPSQPPPPAQGGWDERPNVCVFCSDPGHFQTRCPHAAEYVRRGLCIRNEHQQIVLPNGMFVGRRLAPGNNLKERIDAWNAMQGSAGLPVASANFVDVSSTVTTQGTSALSAADPWAVFTHEVATEKAVDGMLTTREMEEIEVLQNVAASAQRKIMETRARAAAQYGPTTRTGKTYENPPKQPTRASTTKRDLPPHMSPSAPRVHFADQTKPDPPPVTAAPGTVAAKEGKPSTGRTSKNPFLSNSTPQFSYHTPIESPEAISDVVQQHLDSTITITNRQLLAVSPDVRRALKDQIMTKRSTNTPVVAVNELGLGCEDSEESNAHTILTSDAQRTASVETFLNDLSARNEDTIVANHLEDLRCITVKGPGVGEIEAIMDDGSQIIAMRADVWEKTGLPLRTDRLMVMESANKTKSDTKGLLQDFPITIGEFTFYLQVQVVDNAPYEMLLGRPFMTLCQASCRHFSNGDSHLTLVDPNTQSVMTVPTHRRRRTEAAAVNVNSFF